MGCGKYKKKHTHKDEDVLIGGCNPTNKAMTMTHIDRNLGHWCPLCCDYWQVIRLSSHFTDSTNHMTRANCVKKKKIYGEEKNNYLDCQSALCMPTLRAFVHTWTYWGLTATAMRWAWHYGPYCCCIIHFSPCWWILMALHKIGGVKEMLCHGTSIDPIDIRCQQRLAYFSWVYLESTVGPDCIISSVTSIVSFSCFP